MPQAIRSVHPKNDHIVMGPARPKHPPHWTLAYLAASTILWSAVIVLGARAVYWMSLQ
jgi:hypothetical protein